VITRSGRASKPPWVLDKQLKKPGNYTFKVS
jgi:hypothetical protein